MNVKNQSEHFFQNGAKGLGDHNTVSSGPDNGFNNNVAKWFWKQMRHSTTEQAVNNWLSRIPKNINTENEIELFGSGNLNIGGHGNEGQLETGYGQNGQYDYRTNFLGTWNEFYWRPFLEKLKGKKFPIIYIYSCHSGAGQRGADFLYQLARVTGKPVAGRTGFTYANSRPQVWFEKGSVWQVALPDRKPDPIEAPTPHFSKLDMLLFSNGKTFLSIELSQVTKVSLTKTSLFSSPNVRQVNTPDELNKELLKDFFASEPFEIDGQFSAMKTGELIVAVTTDKGEEKYEFDLYNDRLVGDKYGNYYYSNTNIYSIMLTI